MNTTVAPANQHSTRMRGFDHAESFLVVLFAVAVFVWKPGIYVASALIVCYLLARTAFDLSYRQTLWQHPITKVTLALFALGIVTSAISAQQFEDFFWMLRKTLFLPALIFFALALAKQQTRNLAMIGLVASFWIASLVTLADYGWRMDFGARMQGIWPQGTWDNLLGLYLCFLVLWFSWSKASTTARVIYGLTMAMALLMVVLAGGRAPWLALFLSLGTYFLIFRRDAKVIIGAAVIAAVGVIASVTVFQERTERLIDRVVSIADTRSDDSNWIRLQLWGIGLAHMGDLIRNDPFKAVFGSGTKSYQATQIEFFKTMPYDPKARERLSAHGFPSGDTHNNYIDSALRNGLLWTAAMFLYLIWLPTRFSISQIRANPQPSILLLYFYIMAIFYTVVPHFMSFFFAVFVSLLLAPNPEQADRTES